MYSPGLKQKAPTTRELNEEANQVPPKIMEFMKKIVIAEDCEFYKALTYEHWTKLYKFWISTQVECEGERKWMHQHFSLSREDIDTWPALDVLPPELHPATINPADYFGKIPSSGKYNLLDNGLPESFGTNDDAAKKYAALDTLPESNKYMGKYIGDSIQKASGLAKTQLVVRVMKTFSHRHVDINVRATDSITLFDGIYDCEEFEPIILL